MVPINESTTKLESAEDFFEKLAFQKVKKLLKDNIGLICDSYRDEYLRRRFEVRLRATDCASYRKYVVYLNKHPEEYQLLLNDLAINFTQFFRDPDVYQYIETILFPTLFASNNVVRIWSAGCATGEEPYSLAFLANKLISNSTLNRSILIYASDIDRDALTKAEKGVYQKNQLKGLSDSFVNKYFIQEDGVFKVSESIRRLVRFGQFDLNQPFFHKNLDLILCRNVMIYFSKEGQQRIHMNFYETLREGGYLITGKAEIISGEPSKRFQTVDIKSRVYQKPKSYGILTDVVKEFSSAGIEPQSA